MRDDDIIDGIDNMIGVEHDSDMDAFEADDPDGWDAECWGFWVDE